MYLGIDAGGTYIKYGLVDENRNLLWTKKEKTPSAKEEFLFLLTTIIKESNVKKVGISMPGIVKNGFLRTAGAHFELYGFDLKPYLEEQTGCEVAIINDVNTIALSILDKVEAENYIVVALGTGVGGAIVVNRKVVEGKNGSAGEFGFMLPSHDAEFDDSFSKRASTITGLEDAYEELAGKRLNGEEILASLNTDKNAQKVYDTFCDNIVKYLYTLVVCFDPEVIYIGGGVSESEMFMNDLHTRLDAYISSNAQLSIDEVEVTGIHFGNDAGLLGAVEGFYGN